MEFERIQPPYYLKEFVRYFWTLKSDCADALPKALGPLADGCPGFIFQPAKSGVFYDHKSKQLPQVFLYGQTVTRTAIYLVGKFEATGICFQPHSLKPIFGFSANELTDSCLDVSLLSQSKKINLAEQLLNTSSSASQIEILSSFLLSEINKFDVQVDGITRYATAQIMKFNGKLSLRDLQADLSLSERSFERRFNQYVGITPKLFSNICRFQASLNQLKSNNYTNLSDIAFDNGYADQSHFIRAFKGFAGYSPLQFQKHSSEDVIQDFPVVLK
jgi:AraC-like DNA-binding protein